MGLGINGIQGTQQQKGVEYTPVKIKNKDSGKSVVINFIDSEIISDKTKWKIAEGKVYNSEGKIIRNNEINVPNAQAALILAAAKGDGNGKYLDENDLIGSGYGEIAEAELKKANSKFKIAKDEVNNPPMPFGDADAMENGQIYANAQNEKGERIHFEIRMTDKFISKDVYDLLKGVLF